MSTCSDCYGDGGRPGMPCPTCGANGARDDLRGLTVIGNGGQGIPALPDFENSPKPKGRIRSALEYLEHRNLTKLERTGINLQTRVRTTAENRTPARITSTGE